MRYRIKNVAALDIALAALPNRMRVEVDSGIGGVSATTVGQLRNVTTWPENLAITHAAGGPTEKRGKSQQSQHGDPLPQ